ncbi:MAG: hypothetical protein WAU01_02155 [Saprospiraceae bacterium]
MKNIALLSLLFILITSLSGFAQHNEVQYTVNEGGIYGEKFDSTDNDENKYNIDNKIYLAGKKFMYSYFHMDTTGKKYLVAKGQQIQSDHTTSFDWDFIEYDNQHKETIKYIILKPKNGNPFKDFVPDYYQTVIEYEYVMANDKAFTMEMTGVIENEMNIWIHPPRSSYFQILEINPFPYIRFPYTKGKQWNWNLEIGDRWSDKRWLEWKGQIENLYQYEFIGIQEIETKLGPMNCYIVKGTASSRIGETGLISYFNVDYGFVKLDYTNIDGSKTILELEKIE